VSGEDFERESGRLAVKVDALVVLVADSACCARWLHETAVLFREVLFWVLETLNGQGARNQSSEELLY
jgi:hypothetical protein